jgi:hypothetical protein
LAKFFSGDDLAGLVEEESKNPEGLLLNLDTHSLARQHPLEQIDLIKAEPQHLPRFQTGFHEESVP